VTRLFLRTPVFATPDEVVAWCAERSTARPVVHSIATMGCVGAVELFHGQPPAAHEATPDLDPHDRTTDPAEALTIEVGSCPGDTR